MKLAFITLMSGQPFGGSEVLWSKTAVLALEQGHHVAVSGYDWGTETHGVFTDLKDQGAEVYLRPRFSHSMPPIKKIRNYLENRNPKFKRDWNFLTQFRPDHILINQGGCFDLLQHHYDLFQLIKRNRLTYSILSHNHPQYSFIPEPSIYQFGQEVFYSAANTIFISKHQQFVVEKALLLKLENALFTWNPLNIIELKSIPWPQNNQVQFAMVANLISGKGHDIVFEVFSSPNWLDRNWNLNIYGSGYGEEYLKGLAQNLGIRDRVNFRGHISSASDIWQKCHALLIPSSGEGMPISMMEALVSGRLVIATDVGGIREIIHEGINGFLAEAPSVYSFSKAMDRAWEHQEKWEKMMHNSSAIANEFATGPEIVLLKKLLE